LSNRCFLISCVRGVVSPRKLLFFCRLGQPLLFPVIFSFLILVLIESAAYPTKVNPCLLPGDYGEVVWQYNESSPNQLYIIGISHRDALTRSNGDQTPRIQAEVYKIGEWLIQNQGVELLLPEGFLVEGHKRTTEKKVRGGSLPTAPGAGNMEYLEQRFSDDRSFVNAEMLLKENFPLLLRQVEDRDLYQTVYEDIRLLAGSKGNREENLLIRSELDYHQKRRVATMLQKIPGIINEEFLEGHIDNKKALFTIGLSHISDIIRYLEQGKITLRSPLSTPVKHKDHTEALSLAKADFGISVILPRTLVNDRETMERNKLKDF
jgi:hypothetical protein